MPDDWTTSCEWSGCSRASEADRGSAAPEFAADQQQDSELVVATGGDDAVGVEHLADAPEHGPEVVVGRRQRAHGLDAETKRQVAEGRELREERVVAGAGAFMAVEEAGPELIHEQISINLVPLVNAIRSAFPRMKEKGGSILAMSSAAALCSYPMLGAYGAAKAAVDHYVRVAADELGKYKIRVNAVRSGFTNTPVNGDLMTDEHYIGEFNKITPLGPYGEPEEFGPVASLLLSPDSSWITGAIVPVDGGLTLRGYGGGILPAGMTP